MTGWRTHRETEINSNKHWIEFSPSVRGAFRDLTAAVEQSRHFDASVYTIALEWAEGRPTTLHDFIIAMPAIAAETMEHVAKTGDQKALNAWQSAAEQLAEDSGYVVTKDRLKEPRVNDR